MSGFLAIRMRSRGYARSARARIGTVLERKTRPAKEMLLQYGRTWMDKAESKRFGDLVETGDGIVT
jgi:hypothetical protein